MKCVILQPSYIPWRGYFHQIKKADIFVFYDDVQFDTGGWRNRNRIKTRNGSQWLTIPVLKKGVRSDSNLINSTYIDWKRNWMVKHWRTIAQTYSKAPYFRQYAPLLEPFYQCQPEIISELTIEMTIGMARMLGIQDTQFMCSSAMPLKVKGRTERLVEVLKYVGATHYISGPSASDYLEVEKLREANISLEFMTYDYPEYPQLYPPFDPYVSVLDLLFMTGPQAGEFIWAKDTC